MFLKVNVFVIISIYIDLCLSFLSSEYSPSCLIENIAKITNFTLITTDIQTFESDDYVQYRFETNNTLIYFKKDCLCQNRICVRKCCPKNQFYRTMITDKGKRTECVPGPGVTIIEKLNFFNVTEPVEMVNQTIKLLSNNPCTNRKYNLQKDEIFLQTDGTVLQYYQDEENPTEIISTNVNQYCIENKLLNDGKIVLNTYICFPPGEKMDNYRPQVKPLAYGMIISIPFLFLTFAVYAIIPELRNLHGKSLMSYVFTLMVAYMLLAFIQLNPGQEDPWCPLIGFSIFYFFLVSFFWLNVMCFDIWWTFCGFRGFRGLGRGHKGENKRFAVYNLYAWGLPTIILAFCLFMQYFPHVPPHWITPRFGEKLCWFKEKKATLLYFYLPLLYIISTNIFLFVATALKIMKIKKETAMLNSNEYKRHEKSTYVKNKQRFNLYLKLFIVMGVNWVTELISVMLEDTSRTSYAWILTDLANTLQGVLIFIIFVCKRQIWSLLVKRYQILMGKPISANEAFSKTQTTSFSASRSQSTTDIGTVQQNTMIKMKSFN